MTTKLLSDFKTSLIEFLDEMIAQFPEEGDLILSRVFIKDQFPIVEIMKLFVEKLLPYKDLVKKRDGNFFLNNDVLFKGIQNSKVNHFKKLWISTRLNDDDREVIFTWFEHFLNMSEQYIKMV